MTGDAQSGRSVSLEWLLEDIVALSAEGVRIADLTLDSRDAVPGSLFLALRGRQAHGLSFAPQAAQRGASVVLWEPAEGVEPPVLPASVRVVAVPDLGERLGRICDRFFGSPSAQLRVFGITGTNGKTTCAHLLAQCLEMLGEPAGFIGTLGWGPIGALTAPTLTTPDVVGIHRRLAALRALGVRAVAMEVSSHALDQRRVAGVRFHAAAFTNLSRDHLDYHGTMEVYGEAKARLFAMPGVRHVVLHAGDAFARALLRRGTAAPLTAVWIGADRAENEDLAAHARHTLHAAGVDLDRHGIGMRVAGSFGDATLHAALIGRFNAENALVVLGCLLVSEIPIADAAAALGHCAPPPGRLEIIEPLTQGKPAAVIDYAHTPDALAKALGALRPHCRGDLWCVFGCGGDRDPGKRPLMGAVADRLADEIIITDDNPRSEDPAAITRAILGGITRREARVIHDRAAAIGAALGEARALDMVLIAGKGHEEYQVYGETRRPFSDRSEALRHLGAAA
jgi:UDP-N-acetylmuramoyl-L-alanyl-D-glutamate--2,6-diaminopimelate ligase